MSSNSSTNSKLLKRKQQLIQFHITQKAIDGWQCLNPLNIERIKAKDCAIQSLHFIDLFKDRKIGEYYAEQAHLKGGLMDPEIANLLYKYIPDNYLVQTYPIENINNEFKSWFDTIHKKLKKSYATILKGTRSNNTAHMIVVYKNEKGELILLDPQQHTIYSGNDLIRDYLVNKEKYILLSLFYKNSKIVNKRENNKIKKNKSISRTKKRRRLHSRTKTPPIVPMDISSISKSKKIKKTN